jgi:hypothetical protein
VYVLVNAIAIAASPSNWFVMICLALFLQQGAYQFHVACVAAYCTEIADGDEQIIALQNAGRVRASERSGCASEAGARAKRARERSGRASEASARAKRVQEKGRRGAPPRLLAQEKGNRGVPPRLLAQEKGRRGVLPPLARAREGKEGRALPLARAKNKGKGGARSCKREQKEGRAPTLARARKKRRRMRPRACSRKKSRRAPSVSYATPLFARRSSNCPSCSSLPRSLGWWGKRSGTWLSERRCLGR